MDAQLFVWIAQLVKGVFLYSRFIFSLVLEYGAVIGKKLIGNAILGKNLMKDMIIPR